MTDDTKDSWEEWMDNPLMTDQVEGFTFVEEPKFFTQTRQPFGRWDFFGTPRDDRDEVTRHQAYHINNDPDDPVRVLKRVVTWTVDEVPGDGEGQTPTAHILARNDEIQKRIDENTQPSA